MKRKRIKGGITVNKQLMRLKGVILALGICLAGAWVSWMSFYFIEELYQMHLSQMYDSYVEQELIMEDMRLYDFIESDHEKRCSLIDTADWDKPCV